MVVGLKWKCIGSGRPASGTEICNPDLAQALQRKIVFSAEELITFGLFNLAYSSFIKTGDKFFSPDDISHAVGKEVVEFPKRVHFTVRRKRSSSWDHAEFRKHTSRLGMGSWQTDDISHQALGHNDILRKRVGYSSPMPMPASTLPGVRLKKKSSSVLCFSVIFSVHIMLFVSRRLTYTQ